MKLRSLTYVERLCGLIETHLQTSEADNGKAKIFKYFASKWTEYHHLVFVKAVCNPKK